MDNLIKLAGYSKYIVWDYTIGIRNDNMFYVGIWLYKSGIKI